MTNWTTRFAAAAIVGALAYLMYPSEDTHRPAPQAAAHAPGVDNLGKLFTMPAASRNPHASAAPAAQAQSGLFNVDGKGNLLLDAGTLSTLDILLGELPSNPGRIELQRIEDAARDGLPAAAQAKALRLLHGYIAYRKAEEELVSGQEADAARQRPTPEQMLEQAIALRRQHLGDEAAGALFGVREAQARFDLESAKIESDPAMGAAEKTARIAALRKAAPPEIAHHGADPAATEADNLDDKVALLRQGGGSETDVQHLRRQHLGEEGARAVGDMESQKNEWERRYEAFARQKTAILAAALSERQKQQGIESLLRQHYTEEEIDTARAYDLGNSRTNSLR